MSAKSALPAKFLHDEAAAFEKLESIAWPQGAVCPHCGSMSRITRVKGVRMGLRRCGECKKQLAATVQTVLESNHIKLQWRLRAAHLICSSKKGVSAHQLHRYLAEFELRYNQRVALGVNDAKCGDTALKGIQGKRLTYRLASEPVPKGLRGRDLADSRRVLKPDLDLPCGPRPRGGSIAALGCVTIPI